MSHPRRMKIVNGIIRKSSRQEGKWLCPYCLKSGKQPGTCGVTGHKVISVYHKVRLPSYKASKKKWVDTFEAVGWMDLYFKRGWRAKDNSEWANNFRKQLEPLFNKLGIKE